MKTKKENILVMVTAGKESKRFMELAKDAAEAGNGDLYISVSYTHLTLPTNSRV